MVAHAIPVATATIEDVPNQFGFYPLKTGPTPARYVCMGVVSRTKPGVIQAAYLRQQRVHHSLYSSSSMSHVHGMAARLEKAAKGGWGGQC